MHVVSRRNLLMVFLALAVSHVSAQQPDFVVYYVQGAVKKTNAKTAFVLKKGDKLAVNDVIIIPDKSQLFLICKNYKCIREDKAGNIRLTEILEQCSSAKYSFTESYCHYIWDELCNKEEPEAGNYMHNVGAVSRGPGDKIPVWLDTINYLNGNLRIRWSTGSDPGLLKAFDSPLHDRLLIKMTVAGNGFNLDTLTSRLSTPGVYYWAVGDYPQNPTGYCLKIWGQREYEQATRAILDSVIKTDEAETAYMTGFMMEKNYFLIEAARYYGLASKLQPENKLYRAAVTRFL